MPHFQPESVREPQTHLAILTMLFIKTYIYAHIDHKQALQPCKYCMCTPV